MSASLYTFSFTFLKALLLRLPKKECFYRNSLAAGEARRAPQQFYSFFGFVLCASGRSGRPVCTSRKETHFISSQPDSSMLYKLSMKNLKVLFCIYLFLIHACVTVLIGDSKKIKQESGDRGGDASRDWQVANLKLDRWLVGNSQIRSLCKWLMVNSSMPWKLQSKAEGLNLEVYHQKSRAKKSISYDTARYFCCPFRLQESEREQQFQQAIVAIQIALDINIRC
ncbi:hypothetical protein XENOCAPTIV_030311 [Xenoophorus captivus]|uniref:Uncharacterized protein n=1 Tax=Xenoophorus captivus TaxID=1517983 RepID=A0ABV0S4J2_9TELE